MKSGPSQIKAQLLTALLLVWCGLGVGCHSEPEGTPDKVEAAGGMDQLGEAHAVLGEPLTVRVLGPRMINFLGHRGARQALSRVAVVFTVESAFKKAGDRPGDGGTAQGGSPGQPEIVPGDEDAPVTGVEEIPHPVLLGAAPQPGAAAPTAFVRKTVLTDEYGYARIWVKLGTRNGDYKIDAALARRGDRVRFRVVAGARREISEPESVVGAKVSLGLRLSQLQTSSDTPTLKPLRDRRIYYQIVGGPPGGLASAEIKEKDRQSKTNEDGLSEIEVTLGNAPGHYSVLAEVEPRGEEEPIRGIIFTITALDWVLVVLKVAGGILVFVFGVRLLGNGFLLASSPLLHLPTEAWARSRLQGYLGGVAAGAVFESGSLVISHVNNLANGGLLTASAGLALILGANVGGTMLPQILSLDPGGLAAPFLAVGMLLLLVPRRLGLAPWGWVGLGAGLTLTGWNLLSDSAELASYSSHLKSEVFFGDLESSLSFTVSASRFLAYFAVGAALAFMLRTSNLIAVLAILLAASGILRPQTAVPLILGANLGSAAMVFLLSLKKRREAKRLGLANLLVHVLGCFVAVTLSLIPVDDGSAFIWLVERILPGGLLHADGPGAVGYLATAHTAYNFFAGVPFVLFPGTLLRLLDGMLPPVPTASDVKPYHLDRNLIAVPTLALRQATEEVIYLTEVCRKTIAEAFDSFRYNDLDLSDQVVRRQESIAELHRELSQYLVEVSENQLARRDSTRLEILQSATSTLVRLGELGERLRDLSARRIEEGIPNDAETDKDLNEAYDLVMAQFTNILSLLRQRDTKTEENAVKLVERLAKLSSRVEAQTRQRLESTESSARPTAIYLQGLTYQEAFNLLFRVAGHLAHIAQSMRILAPDRI